MPIHEPSPAPSPLFVGGVPRSGTHALAHLIARHSSYTMIPRELTFHAVVDESGLPDLLEKRISLSDFSDRMRSYWWKRPAFWDSTLTRGLYKTIPEGRFQESLERFAAAYPSDAFGAARVLLHDLLDPIARDAGKSAWIEMSPTNNLAAPLLYRVLPDMKLIHIMRDGRDVASSLHDLPWGGGRTLVGGLRTWQGTLRKAHAATQELPSDRLLVIRLEDLVANRRDFTYARILDFLSLEDEPEMRTFFEEKISAENAHVGRWRVSLSPVHRLALTSAYGCALAGLAIGGVAPRPAFRISKLPSAEIDLTRRPQQETIDPWADGRARNA